METPIKVAIVGAGRGRSQLRAIQALPQLFNLVAWVDLNLPLLHERIQEAGLSKDLASDSLEETLQEQEVDAVVVATWAR
ncbi:MAG: Gfo/Idh/MocA family oxidoreductase, partial [bacterium]|nr:Gfo/Idh/MocA family oxidoreductase [bacterium]